VTNKISKNIGEYVNQWKLICENDSCGFPIEFFASSLPANSGELIAQMRHVPISCHHTHGLVVCAVCSDSCSTNRLMFDLLCRQTVTGEIPILPEEQCKFIHPNNEEYIYTFNCSVHLLNHFEIISWHQTKD
jgi:hypothetical protein